jgi:putative SOS response-associated peptidase YedK
MESAAIITTAANPSLGAIDVRMPAILPPEAFDLWLDCDNVDAETAAALLVPAREELLDFYPVSPAVGRVVNDGPDLIEPASIQEGGIEPAAHSNKDDGQQSLF